MAEIKDLAEANAKRGGMRESFFVDINPITTQTYFIDFKDLNFAVAVQNAINMRKTDIK